MISTQRTTLYYITQFCLKARSIPCEVWNQIKRSRIGPRHPSHTQPNPTAQGFVAEADGQTYTVRDLAFLSAVINGHGALNRLLIKIEKETALALHQHYNRICGTDSLFGRISPQLFVLLPNNKIGLFRTELYIYQYACNILI